jgi:hypothetical protein
MRWTVARLTTALLGEEIDQVAVVGALEPSAGQLDDPSANDIVQTPARRGPPAVAVDEPRRALLAEPALEPPDRPLREAQESGRLGDHQRACHDSCQNHRPPLFFDRHRDLPHLGRLTKSLSS